MGARDDGALVIIYRVLRACHQALYRAQEAGSFTQSVCDILVDQGAFQLAWYAGPDGAATARAGLVGRDFPAGAAFDPPGAEGAVFNDLAAEAQPWATAARADGLASLMLLPVVGADRPNGLLGIGSRSPGVFDEATRELLLDLGELLAFGLERLRRDSERRHLYEVLDRSPDFIGCAETDGTLHYLNGAARELMGAETHPHGTRLGDRRPEWARRRLQEEAVPAALRDGYWSGETAFSTPEGEIAASEVLLACHDPDGRPTALSSIARDISPIKRLEQAALDTAMQEQSFANAVLEHLPVLFALGDEQGRIHRWSRWGRERIGYSDEEMARTPITEFFEPEHRERVQEHLREVFTRGTARAEIPVKSRSGEHLDVLFEAARVEIGGKPYLAAFGLDVTERHALMASRDRLMAIIEATPALVATLDAKGVILEMNRGGLQMLGQPDIHQVRGRPWADFVPDWMQPTAAFDALSAAIRNGSWSGEAAICTRDGREVPLSQVVIAHKDPHGAVEYLSTIAQDVSRLKETEHKLRAYVAELESFAYSVSHDLRGPLRSINGFSQILLEEFGERLDQEGHRYLERIAGATLKMGALIEDLLQLSRVVRRELERQPVDLAVLVREIWDGMRDSGDVDERFELAVPASLPAQGDPALLRIALENLLRNAAKFSRERPQPQIEVGRTEAAGVPTFFVRDNGVGFESAFASQMFMPFQRLHDGNEYPGSGIGLAIVKRIIDRHHGKLWAEGQVDAGAVFYFRLGSP